MFKKFINFWAHNEKLVSLVFFVFACIFPVLFSSSPYIISIGVLSLMFMVLSLSLNLMTGYLGITTLGHAAFFGIGAYTAAILSTRYEYEFLVTLAAAILVAAVFGLLLGAPTLRVSGRYLTIVTIGFCEIARIVEMNWMSLTRGPMGIPRIPPPTFFGFECDTPFSKYYVIFIMLIITVIILHNITNSRVGRAISAIKGDDLAAGVMGVNRTHIKLMVFVISAAIAGAAGAFYAHYMSFIDPTSFTSDRSIQIMSMTILGGLGSIPGSIVGAVVLTAMPELLRGMVKYRLIVYGLVIIFTVMFKPNGLLGGFNLKHIRQRSQLKAEEGKADE